MKEKLKQLHQKARIDRDAVATEAYGAALAAIQEGEVRENKDFNQEKVIAVVEKEAGKFAESAASFEKAGRQEQADQINKCSSILKELLPAKLEESAYPELVKGAIEATGASSMRDMGQVMGELKKAHGAALDMKIASTQVKAALS